MPHEAREEQDGVVTRPLPQATDSRFIMPVKENTQGGDLVGDVSAEEPLPDTDSDKTTNEDSDENDNNGEDNEENTEIDSEAEIASENESMGGGINNE